MEIIEQLHGDCEIPNKVDDFSGDKIASSIVAQTAGVPTLPWSGSDLVVSQPETENSSRVIRPITVPDKLYAQGCVQGVESAIKVLTRFAAS